ncbi:DUF3558 domain-containing protein [Nocardia sp. NPDC059177]|uniref:DUF3558 domain-containing protein n=1 Tax=Nocardia sp. NPDC059177 TaxID=3346759 RepID=UPI0036CB4D77
MRLLASAGLLTGVILLASCGTATDEPASPTSEPTAPSATTTTQTRPTLTNPKIQPPSQDNQYTRSSGRQHVVYDPCTWLSDDDVESMHFDPASRKRGEDLVAEYTFLSCNFRNSDQTMSMGVNSGNISWDENLQKNGTWLEETTINGRRAGTGRGESNSATKCEAHLETEVGVVLIWVRVTSLGERQNIDPCADILEVASVVERSIGEGN